MKKKVLAMALAVTLAFSGSTPVMAAEEDPTAPVIEETTEQGSDAQEEPAAEEAETQEERSTQPFIAFGTDLNADQKATVLGLFGISEADLENYEVAYTTIDEEHQYLDAYLPSSVIGTRSLSSVMVTAGDQGSGINVTTHNISYCTVDMYRNALLTAGLEDVNVVVAGPTSISGTAALIGVMKAYEAMTGEDMNEDAFEAATNELVVTGDLSEAIGDSDKASEFVAYIKQQIVQNGYETPEEIGQAIEDAMDKFDVTLSEEQISQLNELMQKISKLDIDVDALMNQAKGLYDKLKDMGMSVDKEAVGNFFTRFFSAIVNLIKGLFN